MEDLAAMKRKLAARRNKPGYAQSNAELEQRIAELEANQ
jgi:hypothetical protein